MRRFCKFISTGFISGLICWCLVCTAVHADTASRSGSTAAPPAPAAPTTTASNPPATKVTGSYEATIVSVNKGRATVYAKLPSLPDQVLLQVPTADLRNSLTRAEPNDVALIEVDDAVNPQKITKITEVDRPVDQPAEAIAIFVALIMVVGLITLFAAGDPRQVLIGVDKRYSNSQVQFALWFSVVAVVYVAAVLLRIWEFGYGFTGGVGLPQNLVVLTGLSTLTFGGAKVIATQKTANAATAQAMITAQGAAAQAAAVDDAVAKQTQANAQAGLSPPSAIRIVSPIGVKTESKGPNFFRDLMQNDDHIADLGDIQLMLGLVGAVIIFLVSALHFLSRLTLATSVVLPDVDSSLLTIFGLGQGAYLIKKAALPIGQG